MVYPHDFGNSHLVAQPAGPLFWMAMIMGEPSVNGDTKWRNDGIDPYKQFIV
jgi:hypothetical protein